MKRTSLWTLVTAAALAAFSAVPARAEIVELIGGRAIQGKVIDSQASEEGLVVELFDTGGQILVRWEHIVPARAKELRIRTGIEVPDDVEIMVPGHRILTNTNGGQILEGRVLNADEKDKPLQLKTRTGVQTFERTTIARVDEASLPGLSVYTADELYQLLRDENPPESAAAHMDLAIKSMRIGALSQAGQHLSAAKADSAFADTPDGRKIPVLEKQLDVLVKSKGAQDMVTQIREAMRNNRWNDALKQLTSLDQQYKDEQVRRLVRFDLLESSVVRGRETYFRRELPRRVHSKAGKLIAAKAGEKKPARVAEDAPRGVAQPGTLAAARQWLGRDFPTKLWEEVGSDLDLKPEEMERFWKERTLRGVQTASYGTGTFIVIKKAPTSRAGTDPNRQRRPPGTAATPQGGPPTKAKEDKPKTEEEWWDTVGPTVRAQWLLALFAETGGLFEVSRTDESELCGGCGGKGVLTSTTTDGGTNQTVCPTCNQAGKVKKVYYR